MRAFLVAFMAVGLLGAADAARADDTIDGMVNGLLDNPSHVGRGIGAVKHKPAPATPGVATPGVPTPGVAVPPLAAPPPAVIDTADDHPRVSINVRFANGSAALTPQATIMLDRLGKALTDPRLAGATFRIEGHTDTVGSAALNKTLSEARAQAVVVYLAGKFSIAAERLQAVGLGEDGLAVPTGPQVAEPRNRCVQVVNISA